MSMLKVERITQFTKIFKELTQPINTPTPKASLPLDDEVKFEGVDERLTTTRFRVDSKPHITVNNEICKECSTRDCVYVCPANLFTPLSDGTILFNYEQCFECGTCYVACNREGAITWTYPRGGYGVSFREA